MDPKVTLKPLKGQIDDLIDECRKRADAKERVLVTTLTKRTAEELTDYLRDIGINVQYLHSEIDAIERVRDSALACARASSTCWSASTCCAKGWTCRKCRWWRFWMRTRKAFCAAKRA